MEADAGLQSEEPSLYVSLASEVSRESAGEPIEELMEHPSALPLVGSC
eukprot:COSAG02_NODE_2541_length_8576_cov_3.531202_8_plen_48_part_00